MLFRQLPVAVEIVKHPGETNGKSTAVHAAVLAPDDVTLRTYPDIGSYDPDEVRRYRRTDMKSIRVLQSLCPRYGTVILFHKLECRTCAGKFLVSCFSSSQVR